LCVVVGVCCGGCVGCVGGWWGGGGGGVGLMHMKCDSII